MQGPAFSGFGEPAGQFNEYNSEFENLCRPSESTELLNGGILPMPIATSMDWPPLSLPTEVPDVLHNNTDQRSGQTSQSPIIPSRPWPVAKIIGSSLPPLRPILPKIQKPAQAAPTTGKISGPGGLVPKPISAIAPRTSATMGSRAKVSKTNKNATRLKIPRASEAAVLQAGYVSMFVNQCVPMQEKKAKRVRGPKCLRCHVNKEQVSILLP